MKKMIALMTLAGALFSNGIFANCCPGTSQRTSCSPETARNQECSPCDTSLRAARASICRNEEEAPAQAEETIEEKVASLEAKVAELQDKLDACYVALNN